MICTGHAPMQIPQRRHRLVLSTGFFFSFSSSAPKGHSCVQRPHEVHFCMKKPG